MKRGEAAWLRFRNLTWSVAPQAAISRGMDDAVYIQIDAHAEGERTFQTLSVEEARSLCSALSIAIERAENGDYVDTPVEVPE